MSPRKTAPDDADAPLKRLGGGRWQTRDERFTIEPQSGTWVVVDAEQTDDLGLPLVRGPFPSLTEAKTAIATARTTARATSPLAARIERRGREPLVATSDLTTNKRAALAEPEPTRKPETSCVPRAKAPPPPAKVEPREPGWIADLAPAERGRARRLIERLTAADVEDAESLVRRDLAGDIPALAAYAIGRRLAELGNEADPEAVAAVIADGRDDALGVRWRLVDGDGRPILLEGRGRHRR